MNRLRWIGALTMGLLLLNDCCPGAEWRGKRILPKSDQLSFRTDDGSGRDVFDFEWPVVVTKVDGHWLAISDTGGVRPRPATGWVRVNDIVLLNEASEYFNRQLASQPDQGSLYWLRGICWESAREHRLAAKDYSDALARSPDNPDARLGLARALAKTQYDAAAFENAMRLIPDSPRLYVDWGQALENAAEIAEAREKYEHAARLMPQWRIPPYRLGQLALARDELPRAIDHFDEAIRRDSSHYLAYRDRAIALLRNAKSNESASQAMVSSRKACELCYYREAESVSAFAQSLAAHGQWGAARRFQQIAVEYAPVHAKARHRKRWHEFALKQLEETQTAQVTRGFEDTTDPVDPAKIPPLKIPDFIDRSAQSFE